MHRRRRWGQRRKALHMLLLIMAFYTHYSMSMSYILPFVAVSTDELNMERVIRHDQEAHNKQTAWGERSSIHACILFLFCSFVEN